MKSRRLRTRLLHFAPVGLFAYCQLPTAYSFTHLLINFCSRHCGRDFVSQSPPQLFTFALCLLPFSFCLKNLPIILLRSFLQKLPLPGFQLFPLKAPFPVSGCSSRSVHPRFFIQFQHILHGQNCRIGHRCQGHFH